MSDLDKRTIQEARDEGFDDCISRAAAIDALADYIHNVDKAYSTGKLSAYDCKDAAWSVLGELPSAQSEIIRCKDCKHWTQSTGIMKGYGLGRCDFHDADLVTCNGFCYWAEERRQDESEKL